MNRYDESLGKNIIRKISTAIIVLFFIVYLIGCNANNVEEPELITAKVLGKVSGDSSSGTINLADLNHISVKLTRLKANGEVEIVSVKDAVTDSHGKYVLETNLDGARGLFVEANKDAFKLTGVLTSTVKSGIAVYLQPLSPTTTVSADLYRIISAADTSIGFNRIGNLIDEEIASDLNNNDDLINRVSEVLKSVFDTERKTFLRTEISGTISQWNQIMSAGIIAQCALDRDLYFADSESAREIAFKNYLNTVSDSYIDAGLQPALYGKVMEVSFRILLNGIQGIDSRLDFDFIKRSSEIKARILNIAMQQEFQMLGADPSLLNKVIYFGDELENSIKNAQTQIEVSDLFAGYKEQQIENLVKALGIAGKSIPEIEDSTGIYKDKLKSNVENGDEDFIISAYINFYDNVSNLVERQINSGNLDQSTIKDVLILLNMSF